MYWWGSIVNKVLVTSLQINLFLVTCVTPCLKLVRLVRTNRRYLLDKRRLPRRREQFVGPSCYRIVRNFSSNFLPACSGRCPNFGSHFCADQKLQTRAIKTHALAGDKGDPSSHHVSLSVDHHHRIRKDD